MTISVVRKVVAARARVPVRRVRRSRVGRVVRREEGRASESVRCGVVIVRARVQVDWSLEMWREIFGIEFIRLQGYRG